MADDSTGASVAAFRPRIFVELAPDGTLWLEAYMSGTRARSALTPGLELSEIREALAQQVRALEAKVAKAEALAAEANAKRHKRVYAETKATFGEAFANTTVGKPLSPARQAHADAAIADLERVCHCGKRISANMTPCEACPGVTYAGKALKQRKTQAPASASAWAALL